MNKAYKVTIGIIIGLVIMLYLYSYFHITGKEFDGASNISSDCLVTINKSYQNENQKEYTLNAEQTQMLKTLILDSTFTRDLSSWVRYYDKDMYLIRIDFNNQQDFLIIDCIGNEYVTVTNQFGGKHLKINNLDWKSSLEKIISISNDTK